MTDKKLEARLVYNGTWKEAYMEEYSLTEDETLIGRAGVSGRDVVIPHDSVDYTGEGYDEKGVSKCIRASRYHARIFREQDKFVFIDLGSKIGTYINGIKLGEPQPEPWRVRFCHSNDYYNDREPKIRERNKGRIILSDGDIITLGLEMYGNKHEFIFRLS